MSSAPSLAIPSATSRRIEKLAEEAGRTPAQMLKYVLRDGLKYTEYAVREANAGLADLATSETFTLSEVKHHITTRSPKIHSRR